MYAASFNFCICTLRLPAVAFVFSFIKVNSASFTLISKLITASLNCECNMGSNSLNTIPGIILTTIYFFEFHICYMPRYDISAKNCSSMNNHNPFKCFYKQTCETQSPCYECTYNRRFEIKCGAINQHPKTIQIYK